MPVLLWICLIALGAQALFSQRAPANSWENVGNLPVSPEVHADRRVTFRVFAPEATHVLLIGAPIFAVTKGPVALTRHASGLWTAVIGPLEPGYYNYGFAIDGGIRSPDPSNPNVERRRWGHTSFFEVPGSKPLIHEARNVPHGTIHIHTYESKSLSQSRPVYVYTPPGYESAPASSRYPTLYLLHGSGLLEEAWISAGRANVILDNLLAEGKAKPMIVVMPYGHTAREMRPQTSAGRSSEASEIESDIMTDLLPFIEKTYPVARDRNQRAIAGLSMGGGQAMYIGLRRLGAFSHIGTFSGSTPYRQELETLTAAAVKGKLTTLWIGCGTDDPAYGNNENVSKVLKSKDIAHSFVSSPGGHIWPVWHKHLSESAPLLFRSSRP